MDPVLQLVEQQLEVEQEQQLVVLHKQLVAVLVEPFSSCSVSVMSRTSKFSDSRTPNSPRSSVRDISHPLSSVRRTGRFFMRSCWLSYSYSYNWWCCRSSS